MVGILLTIKKATTGIKIEQKTFERKTTSVSGKSKVINNGIKAMAAAAGAGTPIK